MLASVRRPCSCAGFSGGRVQASSAVCAPSSSASFYARRATRNAAARSSDSASAAALDEPAAATNETALEVALRPGGGLAVNVKGDVAALLTAVSGLKEVAGGGGGAAAGTTTAFFNAVSSPPAAPAAATRGGLIWEYGQNLFDATHVVYKGELQPLYFHVPPAEGAWPSYGEPFINVRPDCSYYYPRRVEITPDMLHTLPVLRLPADENEVVALLACGAVPGFEMTYLEHDETSEGYGCEGHRKFPAELDGAQKYVVRDGSLRPVYFLNSYSTSYSQAMYGRGDDPTKLEGPALAIYLKYKAPAEAPAEEEAGGENKK